MTEWNQFREFFQESDTRARLLMIELKGVASSGWEQWQDEIALSIHALLAVQSWGKRIALKYARRADAIYRICTATALRQAALHLSRLRFIYVIRDKNRRNIELGECRSALLFAESFLDNLTKRPVRRRLKALWRRLTTGSRSVGFEDLKTAYRETERLVNSILLPILIVIAASKSKQRTLSSLLGTTIEDVIAYVTTGIPPDRADLADFARFNFAVVNARVLLLAFGSSAQTARCRAHLYLLEGYTNYALSRLDMSPKRRQECLTRAKASLAASRGVEWKAWELWLSHPLRWVIGTSDQPPAPMPPWVADVPRFFKRYRMRKLLSRKVHRLH